MATINIVARTYLISWSDGLLFRCEFSFREFDNLSTSRKVASNYRKVKHHATTIQAAPPPMNNAAPHGITLAELPQMVTGILSNDQQATTTLPHNSTTMSQFTTTATDHGSYAAPGAARSRSMCSTNHSRIVTTNSQTTHQILNHTRESERHSHRSRATRTRTASARKNHRAKTTKHPQ